MMFDAAQKKWTPVRWSSAVFRVVCALTAVAATVVQPPSAEAAPYSFLTDQWPAHVVPVTVAPVTSIASPLRWSGGFGDRGRGHAADPEPPQGLCGCRDRSWRGGHRRHGGQWKHGRHGGGRGRTHGKHGKHGGRGRSKAWRPNKGHRKEFVVDRKMVIVNVGAERTLSDRPPSSTRPSAVVLTKLSGTVGGVAAAGEQLLNSFVGTANVVWSVLVVLWMATLAFVYRVCCAGRTKRLDVREPEAESETAIELTPIVVGPKPLTKIQSANDLRPLIDLEPSFVPPKPSV